MRSLPLVVSAVAVIVSSGCMQRGTVVEVIEGPETGQGEDAGNGTSPTGLPPDGGPDSDGGATILSVPPTACSDASKLVYVVSRENGLYSIAPDTMSVARVGALSCPASPGAFPFSMAVDRAGTAWVLYTDGNLFSVSTTSAACSRTSFLPDQAGFSLFGMGFVSDARGGSTDTLYVSENVNGGGLGKIDMATLTLTKVGTYGGALAGQKAELTGTNDATLYGFFLTSPAQVAQIDGTSGSILGTTSLASVSVGTDWAFAFWGGDFYMFTGNATDTAQNGSAVTRYSPADGSVTVVSAGLGFFVVGAGVSTCAPTVAPTPK